MHQDLLQLQTCETFSMTKNKSSKIVTLWNHLDWYLRTHWQKIAHFSGILLNHIFHLDRNDTSNLEPKANPSKSIPTLEMMLQLGKPSMAYVIARSKQIVRIKEKEKTQQKEKLIVMSCTWKIWLSPNENQESQIQKKMCWKNDEKLQSYFSYKDSLFSLGNYVWDEKWPSFIILSLI